MLRGGYMNRRYLLKGFLAPLLPAVVYADAPITNRTIQATSALTKAMRLLSVDPVDDYALVATAKALHHLSKAINILLGHALGDAVECIALGKGSITAAIELTRGGPGTVANLQGERDHPAIHHLRRARTLLEPK